MITPRREKILAAAIVALFALIGGLVWLLLAIGKLGTASFAYELADVAKNGRKPESSDTSGQMVALEYGRSISWLFNARQEVHPVARGMWLFELKDAVLVEPSALGELEHVGDQELDNLGKKVTLRWHIITKGPLAGHFAGTEPGRRDLLFVYSYSLACRRPENDAKDGIPAWLVRAPKAACPRASEILDKNR